MTKDTRALIEVARFNCIISGMIAGNKCREYLQNSPAYSDDSFAVERDKFELAIRRIEDMPDQQGK